MHHKAKASLGLQSSDVHFHIHYDIFVTLWIFH